MAEPWAVFVSELDGAGSQHTELWVKEIQGWKVDPGVGEFGGIVITEDKITDYLERHAYRPSKGDPVLHTMPRPKVGGRPTPRSIAKRLAASRVGWSCMPVKGMPGLESVAAAPRVAQARGPTPGRVLDDPMGKS